MSMNLGLRHDRLLRKQAAQMFEKGHGYRLTARKLGMSAATVREWQKMYRVIGKGGLLAMGVKHTKYDYETKVAAAAAVVDGGMSKPEAMVRFGIASTTPLKQWCRRTVRAARRRLSLNLRAGQRGRCGRCRQRVRRNSKSACASLRRRWRT